MGGIQDSNLVLQRPSSVEAVPAGVEWGTLPIQKIKLDWPGNSTSAMYLACLTENTSERL